MEQPYAYLVFAWLGEAEQHAGTDHITLPDSEAAKYLVDFIGMSEEEATQAVSSITKSNARDPENGELYFFAVRQVIKKAFK